MANTKNWFDSFEPWDQNARALELEKGDVFNRFTDDTASIHLKSDLLKLAASDHPDAVAALREAGIESPRAPKIFHLSDGSTGKVFADANGVWHAVVTIAGRDLDFADDDRDTALMSADRYAQKNREPRRLSSAEELRIARLAASGEIVDACELYVELSLDGRDRRSAEEILTDPKLTPLLNDAARFVWRCARQDYEPFDEFESLLDRIAETKVLSYRVIDALFDRFLDTEAGRAKRRAAPPAPPETEPNVTEEDLDRLSDDGVAKLHSAIVKNRARQVSQIDRTTLGR